MQKTSNDKQRLLLQKYKNNNNLNIDDSRSRKSKHSVHGYVCRQCLTIGIRTL